MQFELEQMRALHVAKGLPVRGEPPDKAIAAPETIAMRRTLRIMTDGLIHTGMLEGSALHTAHGIAATMMAAVGPLVALGLVPTFEEFLLAAKEMVEAAREPMDKGLAGHDWERVRIGAATLGIVCMGLCHALDMPYQEIFREMVDAQRENRPDNVEEILIATGILTPPAANDEDAPQ